MYKHILIPTDGSELEPGMVTDTPDGYKKRISRCYREISHRRRRMLPRSPGVPCDMVQVEHEHPYETIVLTHSNIPVGVVRA